MIVTANLSKRTITCRIDIDAPRGDRYKTSTQKINWLLQQLKNVNDNRVHIETSWFGRTRASQAPLEEVRNDKSSLISSGNADLKSFGVYLIEDRVSSFIKPRKFVELLESIVLIYYETIGQNLRKWVDPVPKTISPELKEKGNLSYIVDDLKAN